MIGSQLRPMTDADREELRTSDDIEGLRRLKAALPNTVSRRAQIAGELATYGCGLVFLAFVLLTAPEPPVGGVFLRVFAILIAMFWTIFLQRRTRKRQTVLAGWHGNVDFRLSQLAARTNDQGLVN
jgi:hypothetical protein